MRREALFYKLEGERKVRCHLCPHNCLISEGEVGICRVRENIDGKLYTLVYGKPIAQHVDPIEKKPLFHFQPGSLSYSIATIGCNLRCKHCQNWDISQAGREYIEVMRVDVPPEEIVEKASQAGCSSISYTYTEPTIFFEYAYETAKLSHKKGLRNVFVTNGYISKEALETIAPYLDAANVDLKAMSDEFYRKICGARLQPVLDSIKRYHELGVWVEVTTLIIPGYNDKPEELREIAEFIKSIDPEMPWHVTAFYPSYKLMDAPPTPVSTLREAVSIGKKVGLSYVYQGNVGEGEDTICPSCGEKLVVRDGFRVRRNIIENGRCPSCGNSIPGVDMDGSLRSNNSIYI